MNKFARIVPLTRSAAKRAAALASLAVTALPMASHAAAIDVTDVTADVGAQNAPAAAIGTAVLLLIVSIKAFKWIRRAL